MKTHTVIEYEQSDFDEVSNNMTKEEAINILGSLPSGYFPYSLPIWSEKITMWDYENFKICCALDMAIEALLDGN